MNAIITAATGYGPTDVQPFLRSVRRACPEARVFMFVYKSDLASMRTLRDQYPFLELVDVSRKFNRGGKVYRFIARHFIDEDYFMCGAFWRRIGRYSLHIMLERFFLALETVQKHRNVFRNVLLTDSRDVIFQRNPFGSMTCQLVSGLEEKTIGDCPINSAWIRDVYGRDVHAGMFNRPIVCAGVTFGTAVAVEQYLLAMCREIWRRLSKVALIAQYDQGIHNFLIYSDSINLELTGNRSGVIATLHYEKPENIRTDAAEGVITVHGKAPAIVHQYDRHRDLVGFVRQSQ
jgi:hypothetical protein